MADILFWVILILLVPCAVFLFLWSLKAEANFRKAESDLYTQTTQVVVGQKGYLHRTLQISAIILLILAAGGILLFFFHK